MHSTLKTLAVALVAGTFAVGAFAQDKAPKKAARTTSKNTAKKTSKKVVKKNASKAPRV